MYEEIPAGPLLSQINLPEDLRKLSREQLPEVAKELRQFIIDCVSVHGGHFGASLGVVELTVALHWALNTPDDQLVWDVGHQAYGHKILTGRRAAFPTNRKYGGLSGFPKRSESEYDAFGVGHSSTSISAALGMAIASKLKGETARQHVAVIGDGAMTAGLPFEALNHAGVSGTNVLVVLNDNNMSIDPNVGALKEYLTDITTSRPWNKMREDVWKLLGKMPASRFHRKMAGRMEAALKGMVSGQSSNLFEALGMRYFGPVDGHNVTKLADTLQHLKDIPGPKLLHIKTVKGKGYDLAEKDQTLWHAPGTFDKITGKINKKAPTQPEPPKYQDVFGWTIVELAQQNEKIMGITPAMPSGCSLKYMMELMPDRALDVGIAEQHAVTLSAGLATQGMTVFCNIYSSFMQRAYDMVVHDVAIQKLPVIFCLDRAGLVGDDGPTHHGCYDIAYMRCIPNLVVSAPMNEQELRNLMYSAQLPDNKLPYVIRYPRGQGVMPEWKTPFEKIETGKGRMISDGEEIAILSIGHPGNFVQEALRSLPLSPSEGGGTKLSGPLTGEPASAMPGAFAPSFGGNRETIAAKQWGEAESVTPAHYDMRFAKPLDEPLLHEIAQRFPKILTVEDGTIVGGFGSAVLEFLAAHDYKNEVRMLGIPDRIVEHGKPEQLHRECGYDAAGIARAVREMAGDKVEAVA